MSVEMVFGVDWVALDKAVGNRLDWAVHPGELLSDWLIENSTTQHDLAGLMGVTDPYLSMIRNGTKGVGALAALKLEDATGVRAEVWMHMQIAFDIHQARTNTGYGGDSDG